MTEPVAATCPCGSGDRYDACCGRLHRGSAQAATPEELMRSRYTAYAIGATDHLFATWHPRTRPDDVTADPDLVWTGLEVHASGQEEDHGWVEFTARYETPSGPGALHEHSRFERRAGRWLYVDGDLG